METKSISLVQLKLHGERYVAMVNEPHLVLLNKYSSVYALALAAIDKARSISDVITENLSQQILNYDEVYNGKSDWEILPSFDHPHQPLECMVSGTGLTHKNSALNRQMMHQAEEKHTDSMKMYEWGVNGGIPEAGKIGVQPEWFYKGNGTVLKAHNQELMVPDYADDGGEEPEVAGVYVIAPDGTPHRIGFTTGNEFSDHVMEKKNYLYLAPSKLRQCAIGPELVINTDFNTFSGKVSVSRANDIIWQQNINSGENNMAHNLANLEYHHFKYEAHRVPLQAHVHFFGADAFSFGSQIVLQDGDEMLVEWEQLGRPLKNYLKISQQQESLIPIKVL